MLFLAQVQVPSKWIQIEDKSAFAARERVIAYLSFLGYYVSRDEVLMILLPEPVVQLGPGYVPKEPVAHSPAGETPPLCLVK